MSEPVYKIKGYDPTYNGPPPADKLLIDTPDGQKAPDIHGYMIKSLQDWRAKISNTLTVAVATIVPKIPPLPGLDELKARVLVFKKTLDLPKPPDLPPLPILPTPPNIQLPDLPTLPNLPTLPTPPNIQLPDLPTKPAEINN